MAEIGRSGCPGGGRGRASECSLAMYVVMDLWKGEGGTCGARNRTIVILVNDYLSPLLTLLIRGRSELSESDANEAL